MYTGNPPSKVEILMNWECNQRCVFCSVGHKIVQDGGSRKWSEIKEDLKRAEKNGKDIVSFSGGEPTIRKDLLKGVELAKKLGFETIEIQTNGCMLKYPDYTKKLVNAGVNRVLVSIHAPNAELEDFLTQTNGSFNAKIQGLKNLEELNVEKRTSTVITKFNYRALPETAKLLLKFKKNTKSNHLNFVIPDGFAKQNFETIVPTLSEVKPFLKKACDLLEKGNLNLFLHNIYPCILPEYVASMSELATTDTLLIGPGFEANLQENRHKYRSKGPQCQNCKYFQLCTGPFKSYTDKRGFSEFKPIHGKKLQKDNFRVKKY